MDLASKVAQETVDHLAMTASEGPVAPLAVADCRVRLVRWDLEDRAVAVVSRVL